MQRPANALLTTALLALCGCQAFRSPPVQEVDYLDIASAANGTRIRLCGWIRSNGTECVMGTTPATAAYVDPRNVWVTPRSGTCGINSYRDSTLLESWAEVSGDLRVGPGQGRWGTQNYQLCDAIVRLRKEPCR